MLSALHFAALVATLGVASWSDVRTGRIPNALTMGGLVAGLALSAAAGGLASSGLAVAVALALGLVLFATGVLGGGDVKLLLAAAALLGLERFAAALVLIALSGAALALFFALRRGVLLPVLLNAKDTLGSWATPGKARAAPAPSTGIGVPYGVAIAVGAVGAWFV